MSSISPQETIPTSITATFINACKAKGVIESIKVPLWRDTTCLNLRIKLKWWDAGYVLYGAWDGSHCTSPIDYDLTWWNLPKIWDTFYAIWTYGGVDLLQIWADVYNENIDLPNCNLYDNPEEEIRDIYDNAHKCQISWKISDMTQKLDQGICPFYHLNITLENQGKYFFVSGTESTWGCLGIDTNFPIYTNHWERYSPKVWDHFSAILDINANYSILKYGEEFLNNDIPVCTGNFLREIKQDPKEISSPSKITPPTINDEKKTDEWSNTWIENLENSWSIQENSIEDNSWNLPQSEIEESIENTNTISTIETWNLPQTSIKKEDSFFFLIWWALVLLILIWLLIFNFYKKKSTWK